MNETKKSRTTHATFILTEIKEKVYVAEIHEISPLRLSQRLVKEGQKKIAEKQRKNKILNNFKRKWSK